MPHLAAYDHRIFGALLELRANIDDLGRLHEMLSIQRKTANEIYKVRRTLCGSWMIVMHSDPCHLQWLDSRMNVQLNRSYNKTIYSVVQGGRDRVFEKDWIGLLFTEKLMRIWNKRGLQEKTGKMHCTVHSMLELWVNAITRFVAVASPEQIPILYATYYISSWGIRCYTGA